MEKLERASKKLVNNEDPSKIFNWDSREEVGKGGFGKVYKVSNKLDQIFAIKEISLTKSGIDNPLELSILSSLNHYCIARALDIRVITSHVHLIMELAKCDLRNYLIGLRKKNNVLKIEQCKKWMFSLIQAVLLLHQQNIVHADIKTSNVLVYEDGSVKLADFSTAKRLYPHEEIRQAPGTASFRAPEVWIKEPLALSLDIWSLGCTFYEMLFSKQLFPSQMVSYDRMEAVGRKMQNSNITQRDKCINSIIDFAEKTKQDYDLKIHRVNGDYKSPELHPRFLKPTQEFTAGVEERFMKPSEELKDIIRIIRSMLEIDPSKRPTAQELYFDPFFQGLAKYPILNSSYPPTKSFIQEKDKIKKAMTLNCGDHLVLETALHVCSKAYGRTHMATDILCDACLFLAYKMCNRAPPEHYVKNKQILKAEIQICESLKFSLHD